MHTNLGLYNILLLHQYHSCNLQHTHCKIEFGGVARNENWKEKEKRNWYNVTIYDVLSCLEKKYFCYVAQPAANKVLIENNIRIFQIPIEKLEEFKMLLIQFYESGNDAEIIDFMRKFCIRRIRS